MGHQLPLIHSETFDESENAMLLQEIGGFHLRLTAFSVGEIISVCPIHFEIELIRNSNSNFLFN